MGTCSDVAAISKYINFSDKLYSCAPNSDVFGKDCMKDKKADIDLDTLMVGPVKANLPYLDYGEVDAAAFEIKTLALDVTEPVTITAMSVAFHQMEAPKTPIFEVAVVGDGGVGKLYPLSTETQLESPIDLVPGKI